MNLRLAYIVCGIYLFYLNHHTNGWMFKKLKFKWSLTRFCPEVSESFSTAYPYTLMPVPECFTPTFYLYTRRSGAEPTIISTANIPADMEVTRKTMFVVHGFRDSHEKPWMRNMTEALLQQADVNVIVTDWSVGAHKELWQYPLAAANTRVCGKALYNLFRQLQRKGLKRRKSHCIGHSLGAHVCGYAGKYKPFGRISGLDPAGPSFEKLPSYARLNKTDGDFVDVLHTDGGADLLKDYGTLVPMGDMDFYANGGKKQPGCLLNRKRKRRDVAESEAFLQKWVMCSHTSAISLYIQSILTKDCQATSKCEQATTKDLNECTACGSECPRMGYFSIHHKGNYTGLYNVVTTSEDIC